LADNSGLASNYSLSSGTFDVTVKNVTFVGSRVYDGTTTVDSSNISSTFTGLVGSETLTLSGSGSVASKNVASGQSVTIGSIAIANGTGVASNYALTSATLNITQRPISLSGSRVYDATTTVSSSNLTTLSNLTGSETLVLSNSGTLSNANAATDKTVTIGSLSLGNGSNGGLGSNYTLSGGTHTLSVTQRPVTVSGSRFYDGTTTVSASDISTFNNRSGGETLTITGSGTVATAIAGSGKTISLGTLNLGDGSGSASNYSLASGTFDVNSRQLNVSGSRVYDNTTVVNGSELVVTTGVGSEIITLSGQGSIANANAENNKTVTQNTLSFVSGSGSSSNYTMGTISLTITPRPVNVSLEKIYDGTLDAPASGLKTNGITNRVGGQTLTLSGTGQMANTGAEVAKTLAGNGNLTLGNGSGSASNYTLVDGSHIIDVTPRTTVASGTMYYTAATMAPASAFNSFTNVVGSDVVSLSGNGSIPTAPVGSKSVAMGTLTSANTNYMLTGASLTVTKRPLNLHGSRVAEMTTPAFSKAVLAAELSMNTVSGETLILTGEGSIPSATPGTSQSITLGTLAFSDGTASASNYTFSGATFIMMLKHKLTLRQRINKILKVGRSGKDIVLVPTQTFHRRVPAIHEKISISTPDQSVTVVPCVSQNGFCN
jgi:hypothetical protein